MPVNPEQLNNFTVATNSAVPSQNQENDVSNKILNDLDLITQKLANEIIDLKKKLDKKKTRNTKL